jgi:hypothetical protein
MGARSLAGMTSWEHNCTSARLLVEGEHRMGQNNDPTEHGDLQGQQGAQPKLSPEERKRQSGYPIRHTSEYLSAPPIREPRRESGSKT